MVYGYFRDTQPRQLDSNSVVLLKAQLDGDRISIDHPLNTSSHSAPW